MAKKYTSINFNHIYDKATTNNTATSTATNPTKNSSLSSSPSFSTPSYSAVSAHKPHGRILVLTRPTPRPVTPPAPSPSPAPAPAPAPHHVQQVPSSIQRVPDEARSEAGSDAISLRPLGRTGPTHAVNHEKEKEKEKEKEVPLISPKPDKFVPPHLRPGFVRREEGGGGGGGGGAEAVRARDRRQGYVEDGRPKSGGYDRARRVDTSILGRPRSSGSGS